MIVHGATFDAADGYGKLSRCVLRFLGSKAKVQSVAPVPDDLKEREKDGDPLITISPPQFNSKAPVHLTMYESTRLPEASVRNLNKRKLVIVPCEHNRIAFKNSGVRTKIAILPFGTNAHYELPSAFNPFTFIHVANDCGIPERKRSKDVIKAFINAFPVEEDVRLIIKKSPNCQKLVCFDKRISVITTVISDEELNTLYKSSHVGVFLSGQEAWGYPHMELMAIGRPVITPFYGGMADFCNENVGYGLKFKMVKTPKTYFNSLGDCAFASIEELIKALRFCYENKEDTVLKGVLAYRQILGFSLNRMEQQLGKLLYAFTAVPKIS